MRGTISHGLLRWKLEMHTTFENRLYQSFQKKIFSERNAGFFGYSVTDIKLIKGFEFE